MKHLDLISKCDCGACLSQCEWAGGPGQESKEKTIAQWNTRTGGWIACVERMPDPNVYVLVSDGENVREDRWYPWREINGRGLLPSDPRCATTPAVPRWATYTNVTHWMPLPSAPRQASNSVLDGNAPPNQGKDGENGEGAR